MLLCDGCDCGEYSRYFFSFRINLNRIQAFTYIVWTRLFSQYPRVNGIAIHVSSEQARTSALTREKSTRFPVSKPETSNFVAAGLKAIPHPCLIQHRPTTVHFSAKLVTFVCRSLTLRLSFGGSCSLPTRPSKSNMVLTYTQQLTAGTSRSTTITQARILMQFFLPVLCPLWKINHSIRTREMDGT